MRRNGRQNVHTSETDLPKTQDHVHTSAQSRSSVRPNHGIPLLQYLRDLAFCSTRSKMASLLLGRISISDGPHSLLRPLLILLVSIFRLLLPARADLVFGFVFHAVEGGVVIAAVAIVGGGIL
jgi:hypothetical protein